MRVDRLLPLLLAATTAHGIGTVFCNVKERIQKHFTSDPSLHFSTNCTDAHSNIAPGDMAFVCNPNDQEEQWQCFDYMQAYGQGPDCNYQCDNQMDEGMRAGRLSPLLPFMLLTHFSPAKYRQKVCCVEVSVQVEHIIYRTVPRKIVNKCNCVCERGTFEMHYLQSATMATRSATSANV